jgi:hypothetical protein
MKARLEDKILAIKLRKQGLSYSEIQKIVKASKGQLSGWFKLLELSAEEEIFLRAKTKEKSDSARLKSMFTNRSLRLAREAEVVSDAKKLFHNNCEDQSFVMGIVLYWAEGAKRTSSFAFVNTDHEMIVFMSKWIEKYLKPNPNNIRYRLFTHKIFGHEDHEGYWCKKLGLEPHLLQKTIYKPTIHSVKKNPNYYGCFRIGINGIYYLRLMIALQKVLLLRYGTI